MEIVNINIVKANPDNPRLIKNEKYKLLLKSITQSPSFMELNPLKVDENMRILGGNMRYRACVELKVKEVQIKVFTRKHADINNKAREKNGIETATYEDQCRELIIKDNVGYGEHDWDILANSWDTKQLKEYGMDVWQPSVEADYSLLDDNDDLDNQLDEMTNGVKKAIQIEFEPNHYEEAYAVVKFWREQDAYVGKMILDFLKSEKNKL